MDYLDRKVEYNTIIFNKENCASETDMFNLIGMQILILLKQGYTAVVRYDEPDFGIVLVEFENDENLDPQGCSRPMWVTSDEADKIECERRMALNARLKPQE